MARSSRDARLKLGEPWSTKLADFCAANYNCPQIEVVREALDAHIDARLEDEPELRKRFDAARRKRHGGGDNVEVLKAKR